MTILERLVNILIAPTGRRWKPPQPELLPFPTPNPYHAGVRFGPLRGGLTSQLTLD